MIDRAVHRTERANARTTGGKTANGRELENGIEWSNK